MPTLSTPNLTLTESDGRVEIQVVYTATFSAFERQLIGLGANYHSHVQACDFDGGDTAGGTLVDFVPRKRLDTEVPVGSGRFVLPVTETMTVARADLKGDPENNDDEIKAKVKIHAPALLEFTDEVISDQEVLAD